MKLYIKGFILNNFASEVRNVNVFLVSGSVKKYYEAIKIESRVPSSSSNRSLYQLKACWQHP